MESRNPKAPLERHRKEYAAPLGLFAVWVAGYKYVAPLELKAATAAISQGRGAGLRASQSHPIVTIDGRDDGERSPTYFDISRQLRGRNNFLTKSVLAGEKPDLFVRSMFHGVNVAIAARLHQRFS
jgi:hypothetical protein